MDKEIDKICLKYNIKNYEITSQGVNVRSLVRLAHRGLFELPLDFNEIHGNFDCSDNKLRTLLGTPKIVHGNFNCENNNLKSLQGAPKFVQGTFYCSGNEIPIWETRYLLFSEIHGRIYTGNLELNSFFEMYKNKKSLIPQALKELKNSF